jgi:RNA polymerase sigma-70 factor (ECF subfamily)
MTKKLETYNDFHLYELLRIRSADSEAAFRVLYNRYSKKVYLYCRKILGNELLAEDVFQEIFIKLSQTADKNYEIQNFSSFLFRIARNLCLNAKKSMKHTVELDEYLYPAADDNRNYEEIKELVGAALEILPDDQKEAFVLQLFCGMSYDEISESMNVPVTTVRNWLVRSKTKLRKTLQPYFNNDSDGGAYYGKL